MTISIDLPPEMESFVKRKVADGFYGDAVEVVKDAVRRMQAEDIRLAAWLAAIRKGADQLDRGEGIDYTPLVLDDITETAIRGISNGRPIDPDVFP